MLSACARLAQAAAAQLGGGPDAEAVSHTAQQAAAALAEALAPAALRELDAVSAQLQVGGARRAAPQPATPRR